MSYLKGNIFTVSRGKNFHKRRGHGPSPFVENRHTVWYDLSEIDVMISVKVLNDGDPRV